VIRGIVCFCLELLTASRLRGNFRKVLNLNVKVSLYAPWRHTGKKERSLYSFLTLGLGGGDCLTSRHGRFTLRKERRYPLSRSLIGSQNSLRVLKKRKIPALTTLDREAVTQSPYRLCHPWTFMAILYEENVFLSIIQIQNIQ
jgi:hypothetical protein